MQVDLKNAPAGNLLPFLNRPKNPRNFFEALPLLTNELGKIIDPVFSFLCSLSSSLSSSVLSSLSSALSSSLSSSQSSQSNIQFVHLISSQRSRIIISLNHSCPNCPGLSLFTSDTILPVRLKKSKKIKCMRIIDAHCSWHFGWSQLSRFRERLQSRFVERISSTRQLHPLQHCSGSWCSIALVMALLVF